MSCLIWYLLVAFLTLAIGVVYAECASDNPAEALRFSVVVAVFWPFAAFAFWTVLALFVVAVLGMWIVRAGQLIGVVK